MPLTQEDLAAIQLLLSDMFARELTPFKEEVRKRFSQVDENFDAVFKQLETLNQEYYASTEGIKRSENRIEDHEERIKKLEAA